MEFENLQIEVPIQKDNSLSQTFGIKIYEKKYHNKTKNFVVGFNPNSKEYLDRKLKRARRFGLQTRDVTSNEETITTDLDQFKDIDLDNLEWPSVPDEALDTLRPHALLLYGVNHMSTKDVFEYFNLFGPEALEWVDDSSCAVVWDEEKTVIQAIDTLSKMFALLKKYKKDSDTTTSPRPSSPVVVVKEEGRGGENERVDENTVVVEDDEYIDPKEIWRVALPFKNHQLFLRLATISDKKLPGAAERSEYYLLYGRNPDATKHGPGVLSKSRKRKLERMKQVMENRFKMKEPDVKIVDLEELKSEGIDQKMEIDEPVVKRLNLEKEENSMSMVADRLELQQRVGTRYSSGNVHDRLGEPIEENNKTENEWNSDVHDRLGRAHDRLGGVHDRLGVSIRDRLGTRNDENDVRDEIENSRCNRSKNRTYGSGDGYEDDDGTFHDIYQAGEIKPETEDDKQNLFKQTNQSQRTSSQTNQSDRTSTNQLVTVPDLRDKLRQKEKSTIEKNIKEEADVEKLNLCIEIKQEFDVDMESNDFEF